MDFLRLPLTALAGWALYAERFDLATMIGAAMILGGNAINLGASRAAPRHGRGTKR
jgi:drug/metabolite transporter (DMT)-like permease